jgi:hypothetical protein
VRLPSKFTFFTVFIIVLVFSTGIAFAQQRCGTVEYSEKLRSQKLLKENDAQFERWLQQKQNSPLAPSALRKKQTSYKIPVVVHVIHNGEPVGTGTNIPDAQILSQIKVLNADYQRKNADAVNTPAEFQSVAAGFDIEFVLAKRDPEGLVTNGISRVKGTKTTWTSDDNYELKQLSYWPSEDYFNIWVCNISDFLGFSQFPESDLPGLENSSTNAQTDGVVIFYKAFGSIDDGNFTLDPDYNKGRTLTHEASHFFGLRHIWGDVDGCFGTDYVDDTPNQDGYTSGCPVHPHRTCDPPIVSMFQNFTDYTDDKCMNLFTKQQVQRMETVIENSPRRVSLLTSKGLQSPDPVNNDLGIKKIASPPPTQCSNLIVPAVTIKNYGKNNITSARIRLDVNGVSIETKNIPLSLTPLDSVTITFNSFTASTGFTTLTFNIMLTNGVPDGDAAGNNNTLSTTVFVPSEIQLPFTEDFSALSTDWTIQNPDQQVTWEVTSVPDGEAVNKALALRFFDYKTNLGEQDILLSPVFDLSNVPAAALHFDVSNARFDKSLDALKVIALTNCSTAGIVIYDKSGADLATVSSTKSYFTPNGREDWRTEFVDLSSFVGERFVQLAFIGINGYGNNLYLDNIAVATLANDISLNKVISPALVTCDGSAFAIEVQNTGVDAIESVNVAYQVNGGASQTKTFGNLDLQPGKQTQLSVSSVGLNSGENMLSVTLVDPNGMADENSSNNSLQKKIVVNQAKDRIPLRQTFDKPFDDWTIVNPGTGMNWAAISTNYDQSLYFNAFDNPKIGDESWLVTPVLDFSGRTEASVTFDISYRRTERKEGFSVLISEDCGNVYQDLGYELPEVESLITEGWSPDNDSSWLNNQYIDLSDYAGKKNIRIAFVATNANSNNLYLDNIEFFVARDRRNIIIENQYSVFGYQLENMGSSTLKVGFNLNERQNVKCEIFDTMGRLIASTVWEDVLNQVFELPVDQGQLFGTYILRVNIGGKYDSKLIYFTH